MFSTDHTENLFKDMTFIEIEYEKYKEGAKLSNYHQDGVAMRKNAPPSEETWHSDLWKLSKDKFPDEIDKKLKGFSKNK